LGDARRYFRKKEKHQKWGEFLLRTCGGEVSEALVRRNERKYKRREGGVLEIARKVDPKKQKEILRAL